MEKNKKHKNFVPFFEEEEEKGNIRRLRTTESLQFVRAASHSIQVSFRINFARKSVKKIITNNNTNSTT